MAGTRRLDPEVQQNQQVRVYAIRVSAAPQFGGWLRNSRRLGVSLPVAELPFDYALAN